MSVGLLLLGFLVFLMLFQVFCKIQNRCPSVLVYSLKIFLEKVRLLEVTGMASFLS